MAGGGAHEERIDVNCAQSEERDEGEEGGSGAGARIYFPFRYAAAVVLVTASCKSVCCLLRSERKREELLRIATSLTPQKAAYSPETSIYTEGRGQS